MEEVCPARRILERSVSIARQYELSCDKLQKENEGIFLPVGIFYHVGKRSFEVRIRSADKLENRLSKHIFADVQISSAIGMEGSSVLRVELEPRNQHRARHHRGRGNVILAHAKKT